jgi:hypothetical protein
MKSLHVGSAAATLLLASVAIAADHPYPAAVVAPGAKLITLYEAERFLEGPTWDPSTQKLYFTSFQKTGPRAFNPETEVLRLDAPGTAMVWLAKAEGLNGTFLAHDGGLLGAQAFGHRLMHFGFGPDGPSSTKVLLYDRSLNQPNDVCQASNGEIYFTDPDFKERKTSAVYRLGKDGKAQKILDDMPLPNGLKTSLDALRRRQPRAMVALLSHPRRRHGWSRTGVLQAEELDGRPRRILPRFDGPAILIGRQWCVGRRARRPAVGTDSFG